MLVEAGPKLDISFVLLLFFSILFLKLTCEMCFDLILMCLYRYWVKKYMVKTRRGG